MRGFTLIELLLVVGLLGLVAVAALRPLATTSDKQQVDLAKQVLLELDHSARLFALSGKPVRLLYREDGHRVELKGKGGVVAERELDPGTELLGLRQSGVLYDLSGTCEDFSVKLSSGDVSTTGQISGLSGWMRWNLP